jgi:hypothetical protein
MAAAAKPVSSTSAKNFSTMDSKLEKSLTRYRDCSTGGGKALGLFMAGGPAATDASAAAVSGSALAFAVLSGWSEKRTFVPPRSPSKTSAIGADVAAARSAHRMLAEELHEPVSSPAGKLEN